MKKVLIAAVIFQGISGMAGGIGLISDPTGKSLNIPIEWLQGSPFNNYLLPGILLLIVLGIYPLIIAIGLLRNKYWGWMGSSYLGIALLIWIIVEIMVIGYQADPPLQLIYGLLSIIILILVYLPGTKNHFHKNAAESLLFAEERTE